MKSSTLLLGLVGLASAVSATTTDSTTHKSTRRDHDTNDYYVLHLDADTSPDHVARRLGLAHDGQLGELDDHHVFSSRKQDGDIVKRELAAHKRRKRSLGSVAERSALDGVLFAQKQVLRRPWEKRVIPPKPESLVDAIVPKSEIQPALVTKQKAVADALSIKDPIFKDQWHLFNTMYAGHDVNVTDIWLQGITGQNTTVAIVDDGLDMYSDDLKGNYYAKGSYDFNEQSPEPRPRLSDDKHGTRCAGEISAVRNDVCGVGVAYDSKIAGLRILSKAISDADEAVALNYDMDNNLIYSCSWGPPDDGRSMDAPGIVIRRAMLNAVQKGRQGLGSIYVFASGNGAASEDNCNFDGYTNSIYSITVGAVDYQGQHPYYSEKCSASLVVTYSSGGGEAIHTTDVGTNACYSGHGGTSAAAPLAAGIFALALQVRPDLTWRDMQYLVMNTAVPINTDMEGEWQKTFIGKYYSHTFAYGKVDSYALVEAAKTWVNVKPQAWFYSPWIHVHQPIPQGDVGLAVEVEVTKGMLDEANFERIEHVTVTMNVEHTRRGDISVDLFSPEGIVSHLSATRKSDNLRAGYIDWTFMSVVHWGESGIGKWRLVVKDTINNEHQGNLTDFHLKFWGECIDAKKATLLPMPKDTDDDDHDITMTTTLPAATTTLSSASTSTPPPAVVTSIPADHPDRPVKPTAGAASSSSSASASASPTAGSGSESETEHEASPSASSTNTSWLPAFLANMSTKKQIWVYGALGSIVAFCLGLGVYLYMARRKRLLNDPRDNYEFELLDEEEGEALNSQGEKGMANVRKGRRKATRGRELYDAFAEGSDDDEDDDDEHTERTGHGHEGVRRFSLGLDDDDEGYDRADATTYHDRSGATVAAPKAAAAATPAAPAAAARGVADEDELHVIGDDSDEEETDSDDGKQPAARRGDSARLL